MSMQQTVEQLPDPYGYTRGAPWVLLSVPLVGTLYLVNKPSDTIASDLASLVGCAAVEVLSERVVTFFLSGKSYPWMGTIKADRPSVLSWTIGDTLELRVSPRATQAVVVRIAPLNRT